MSDEGTAIQTEAKVPSGVADQTSTADRATDMVVEPIRETSDVFAFHFFSNHNRISNIYISRGVDVLVGEDTSQSLPQ